MLLKVCGMREADNILDVAKLYPDFLGFIFYSQSKRFVGDDFIMPDMDNSINKTGVFVDATTNYIKDKISQYQLDAVQLHGSESAQHCETLRAYGKVIKAFGVDETFDFELIQPYTNSCDYFLFDTKNIHHGGSGKTFDWKLLKRYQYDIPFFLSGGISENDAAIIKQTKAVAIDINSRFENYPGNKNVEKIKQFKHALQSK